MLSSKTEKYHSVFLYRIVKQNKKLDKEVKYKILLTGKQ